MLLVNVMPYILGYNCCIMTDIHIRKEYNEKNGSKNHIDYALINANRWAGVLSVTLISSHRSSVHAFVMTIFFIISLHTIDK